MLAKTAQDKRLASRVATSKPSLPIAKYAGVYGDSLYGDLVVTATNGALSLIYGNTIDATLEHWAYDSFMATASAVTVGKLMTTFAIGADGTVKTVDVEGLGTFGRRPEKPDTAKRATR